MPAPDCELVWYFPRVFLNGFCLWQFFFSEKSSFLHPIIWNFSNNMRRMGDRKPPKPQLEKNPNRFFLVWLLFWKVLNKIIVFYYTNYHDSFLLIKKKFILGLKLIIQNITNPDVDCMCSTPIYSKYWGGPIQNSAPDPDRIPII